MGPFVRAVRPALLQRCPRCRRGPVFRRFIWMNGQCPACGFHFEREPGYFTGAMYVSYTLGILATAPLYFLMLYLELNGVVIVSVTAAVVGVLFPLLFRYSRVLWMYLDHGFNPVEQAPPRGTSRPSDHASGPPSQR